MNGHAVAQEDPLPGAVNGAFGDVDLECQSLFKESGETGHDPLTAASALHVDVAVVGVTAEDVTAPLQFLVELVEQDVRQKGG